MDVRKKELGCVWSSYFVWEERFRDWEQWPDDLHWLDREWWAPRRDQYDSSFRSIDFLHSWKYTGQVAHAVQSVCEALTAYIERQRTCESMIEYISFLRTTKTSNRSEASFRWHRAIHNAVNEVHPSRQWSMEAKMKRANSVSITSQSWMTFLSSQLEWAIVSCIGRERTYD